MNSLAASLQRCLDEILPRPIGVFEDFALNRHRIQACTLRKLVAPPAEKNDDLVNWSSKADIRNQTCMEIKTCLSLFFIDLAHASLNLLNGQTNELPLR